jgi:hypothetical protein
MMDSWHARLSIHGRHSRVGHVHLALIHEQIEQVEGIIQRYDFGGQQTPQPQGSPITDAGNEPL